MLITGDYHFSFALEPRSIVINQSGAPIKIEKFEAKIIGEDNNAQIKTKIRFKNYDNKKTVVAFRVNFVGLDVFDEFLTYKNLITIANVQPGKRWRSEWTLNVLDAASYLTGAVFVDKIRFDDDTFWDYDETVLIQEMKKIQEDFDLIKLQEMK